MFTVVSIAEQLQRSEVLFCHLHHSENFISDVICCLFSTGDNERGKKESTAWFSDLVLSLKHCCWQSSSSDFEVNKFNTYHCEKVNMDLYNALFQSLLKTWISHWRQLICYIFLLCIHFLFCGSTSVVKENIYTDGLIVLLCFLCPPFSLCSLFHPSQTSLSPPNCISWVDSSRRQNRRAAWCHFYI